MEEEYYKKILDNLPVGIAIHTPGPEFSFYYFNDHFLKFYRINGEALSKPDGFWENAFEDPVFREQMKTRITEDLGSGDPERMFWEGIPISRRDEDTSYINAKCFPIHGSNTVISIVWDVTKRKYTEEQLRKNRIKLGDAMDLAKLVNWEYDIEKDAFWFDDRFYALYGTTKEREGETMTAEQYAERFIPPEERFVVAEEVKKAIETTDPDYISQVEHRIVRREGENRYIIARIRITKDTEGRTVSIWGANQDITDQKIAEEKLKKSEEKFRNLVENINDAIFTFDLKGNVKYINPVVRRLYGYKPDEIINHHFTEFLHPDDVPAAVEEFRHRLQGEFGEKVYRVIPKDGSVRYVRVTQTPIIQNGSITGFNYIMTDLTERKRAEEALSVSNKKLNMLSSITRHDILNTIMAIRGYIELSEDDIDNPELRKYVEKEKEAVNAIQHQIEFTRYYQDIGVNEPKWHDAGEIADLAAGNLDLKEITFENSLRGVEIYSDPLIEKVFYNLMENSLRHGGHITSIGFSYREENDRLIISYKDDGVGIREDERSDLFRKGFGKHTGLGLFLSKEILSITDIEISENGREGEGVCFEISVPKGGYRFENQ